MERRDIFRWIGTATRIVSDWFRTHLNKSKCHKVIYSIDNPEQRAFIIGSSCPNCVCELVQVGRHGSPGPVNSSETLFSLVIDPTDVNLGTDQLNFTLLSHAEYKGMSVMRDSAKDGELEEVLDIRLTRDPKRKLLGVVCLSCAAVRKIIADTETKFRKVGERLFSVLDLDTPTLPNHAEIFATVPVGAEKRIPKEDFRAIRPQLLNLMSQNFVAAREFRQGKLVEYEQRRPKQA